MYLSCWSGCLSLCLVSSLQPEVVVHAVILALGRRKNWGRREGKENEIYKVPYFWDKDKEAGRRRQVFRGRGTAGATGQRARSSQFVTDSQRNWLEAI